MSVGPKNGGEVRIFPLHRLPPGFLDSLEHPPDPPALPRPSATLTLLREGRTGLEVLLLKRSPRSGFIPGAWVFPGGTVDLADGDPRFLPRLYGITPEGAEGRLKTYASEPPALAYWVAAIRETFEETGVLIRRRADGTEPEPHHQTKAEALARSRLLVGELSFMEVLETLDLRLDAGALEYNGHWLTPECEPRRYETRFFATEVRRDTLVTPHDKEMVEARWLTPTEALTGNAEGTLPLVFPTLFTLEELEPFRTPRKALDYLRGKPVPRRLPTLRRTEGGIGFSLEH